MFKDYEENGMIDEGGGACSCLHYLDAGRPGYMETPYVLWLSYLYAAASSVAPETVFVVRFVSMFLEYAITVKLKRYQ